MMTNGLVSWTTRLAVVVAACCASAASPARASQLIDRDATGVTLQVNNHGEALISYRAHGQLKHVLAWGAINALSPSADVPQVAFKLDYSGGWGKYHRHYWETFENTCKPYHGEPVPWQVAGCVASDGSLWALQSWQRALPDYGVAATAQQSAWELRLSHWSGAIAVLNVQVDWAYHKFDHLFGTFSYDGHGIYGFRSTASGVPLDTYGRNIYVDTLDSSYGTGWRRENSFLTHSPGGSFCYGFFPHGSHPIGAGKTYRITVIGPGVTPDVTWQSDAPGPFDAKAQAAAGDALRALADPKCRAR